ncbi:MAG: electron transporter [Chlorogloeopsis fritschii C42_A2020_084]|uniref:cyclic electron transport protein PGR5 n=1 Tax=Chlorogloeopsis fritschii TaxID=1124 RepID=UPI0019E716E5|nr:electron transporter [Chlorogloeopsis fritschii]MBF2006845.1 electron transporter [Chlorogloeopsis fritschii C42_A2020_084]
MFAPIVVNLRNWMGKAKFNQLRGKAIALHAQVITSFCSFVGIASKERQNLIRLAKDNGKKLGLLA